MGCSIISVIGRVSITDGCDGSKRRTPDLEDLRKPCAFFDLPRPFANRFETCNADGIELGVNNI